MSVTNLSDGLQEDWEEETYLFSSAPTTPRERTPDILVRFQAVSSDRPCLDSRTIFISSQCTLIEVRRQIQRHFQYLYERGFIFLNHHREISRSQERAIKLLDVLPKVKLGHPRDAFIFPGIQYKKLPVEKEGRRDVVTCVGVVYICEASSDGPWTPGALREELSGNPVFANNFGFVPAFITSGSQEALDLRVDELNHLATIGAKATLQYVLSLLPSDVKPNKIKDHRLATPLHYASQNGHVEVCEALIGRFGYDMLYMKDCNLRTPLHCALHMRKLDVVCYLLHLSPDLEWHDAQGFSCVRMLHRLNSRDTLFLMTRLEPEVLDPQLVLHFAIFALTVRDLKQALRYCRLAPVVRAPFYRPPLHLAAELGDLNIIEALLSDETVRKSPYRRRFCAPPLEDVNSSSEASKQTQSASGIGHAPRSPEMTYRLTSDFVDRMSEPLTARTDSGISSCSVKNRPKTKRFKFQGKPKPPDPDTVSELEVLLEDVVDACHSPMTTDSDGHLPFHYACQHGHHAALSVLYFSDMRKEDFLKGIRLALNWKRYEVIQTLPSLRSEYALDGETLSSVIKESEKDLCFVGHTLLPLLRPHPYQLSRLLSQAALTGAGDMLQMLLNMHVAPNTPDFLGRTPLHEACQQNRVHVVGVLLNEGGADPNVRDWRGSTPLHYACAAGHLEVVQLMLEFPRTIADCKDVMGRTPLLVAAHCNQQHVLSALVKRYLPKLSPLETDVEGRTVLHYLTSFQPDVMKELVKAVCDIQRKDVTTPTEPYSPPIARDVSLEAELHDIWDDPSYPNYRIDVRGQHARNISRKRRLMMTISCGRCGKSFSCTQRTKNWYHLCSNSGVQSGPPSLNTSTLGRALVRLPTFLPAGTDESAQDPNVTRHIRPLPVTRPATSSQCDLTPLDVAILNNNVDVITELTRVFPHLAKKRSTAVLAARMANWEALKTLHKASNFTKSFLTHLVHIACIQRPADRLSTTQFIMCIRLLFRFGASPNYIPDPDDFKDDRLSPSEESLVSFSGLEVAAIFGDLELADLLLEGGSSASICFAVHLAALKGNIAMLTKLLPLWKEGRWKPYIKAFEGDANELVRVCTLESGLVQAACASEQVSIELLKMVVEREKDILQNKKILTHHMVYAVRPHVCCLTRPTLMNKILYKHIDDMAEDDHVCQHLPLSNLLRCPEQSAGRKVVQMIAVYLVQQGAYLSEMRVSRKSQVHVACEVFVLGVKRRMWKLVEVLLIEAGVDIWSCLLAPYHTCHKYVYSEWSDAHNGFLCLSKGILRVFHVLPLNLLRLFLEKGKAAMKDNTPDSLRAVLMPRNPGDVGRTPRSPRTGSPRNSPDENARPIPVLRDSPILPAPGSPQNTSTPRQPGPMAPKPDAVSPTGDGSPASAFKAVLNGGQQDPHTVLMTYLLAYHARQAANTRGYLMVLGKLTLLCPPLLIRTLPVLRFHLSRHTWLAHVPRSAVATALKKQNSTTGVIQSLSTELMEVSLWIKMSALPVHQVMAIQEQGLTLLHLACLFGDARLAKACLTVVVSPLPPDIRSWSGITPLEVAAAQGNMRLLDVLVKYGAHAPKCILVAACVGKAYTDFYTEKSEQARLPDEKTKLLVVQWCARALKERIDLAFRHPKYGTVFDVILKKHHWAVFDWLLSNTEAAPLSKLLARCHEFAELAQAPEAVISRVLKSQGDVLLALPSGVMHQFLLALTLRTDALLERVVRRLMSLDYFSSHERLLAIVTARGKHKETIMHNMCRAGHATTLKLFLCLFSTSITRKTEISDFLDAVDNSGCTPLWYCLAMKRWTMAEYLITSGVRVSPLRAVPDFCIKRPLSLCPGRDHGRDSESRTTRRRSFKVTNNASTQMAQILNCDNLLKIYKNQPRDKPNKDSLVNLYRKSTSQQAPSDDSVMRCMAGVTLSDSGLSVSDCDVSMTTEIHVDRKRNLRYLMSLIHYAGLKGATLLHAAAAVGDKDLLEGLAKSPYCAAQLSFSKTFSPFIYALANSQSETVMACLHHGLGPYQEDPTSYALARAILGKCGIRQSEQGLRQLLAHQKMSSETEEALMNMVSTRAPWSAKVRCICTHISATSAAWTEHDLVRLVQETVKAKKGVVSDAVLVAAGITGKLWVFKAIMESVESRAKLAELCTRIIVPKAAFIDLLYLFAPRRMTLEAYAPEYFDRMKILRCISSETRLVLQPQTLRAAIRKNLLPMLEMVIKDHIRNRLPLLPSSLWFESIFKASTIGDVHYVNTVCAANLNVKVKDLQAALLRALCLACLHRHKQIANRLLLFKLPLLTAVTDLPGEFYMQPQLVLETAIEGGDSVVASLILQTMEETGLSPSQDDILRAIFMAFRKGMEPIIDNLLMFAHYAAPDLVTKKVCHRLFLVAARSGHGRICSKFLNLEKLNVRAVDGHGFTALHYACMYNRPSLVRAIIAVAPSSVQAITPDGLTPLDLARCMGNWELAYELISQHNAVRGEGFNELEVQGWMKRLLILNEQLETEEMELSSACITSREMTIRNLLTRGDDRAARCFLEVAQESMVSCMVDDYQQCPLFHLCARYGCESSLQLLLRLIDAQPHLDPKMFLETEIDGMVPLALAIIGGHVQCTKLLTASHYPAKWRTRTTGESILHLAARGGQEEIVQMVSERASNTFLQRQDKDGLIPATTAVAFGNHHVVRQLLHGLRFAEKLHHEHLQTTYWCILCLLDMCIGWSKSYQLGRTSYLCRRGRNIFQRHRTETGFTVCSDVGTRAVMGRVLDSSEGRACLLKWMTPEAKKVARRREPQRPKADLSLFHTESLGSRTNLSHTLDILWFWTKAGASSEILESALGAMQYADRSHRSQLFLLLSHMTRYESVCYAIQKRQDSLATYLYSKLHPAFDPSQKRDFFLHACAQGLPSLVEGIMTTDPSMNYLVSENEHDSRATGLDLAVAFGHSRTVSLLLEKLEGGAIDGAIKELRTLTPFLSVTTQWKLGMAKIGDTAWRASMDFSLCRLSHVDLYLIAHATESSFPGTFLPRDIMATSVCGKELEVDHLSMKGCVSELGVDDTWLTAHMMSRAVLGRYHTEVNEYAEEWQLIDKITLHCLPHTSVEEAKVVIQGHNLHDIIKVEKHKRKDGSTRFSVVTGALPLSLTSTCSIRQGLVSYMIPEFKQLLAVLHGLPIDVTVDWNSIESGHDLHTQRRLLQILAGSHGSAPLAGLMDVMEMCLRWLQDITLLVNRMSAQEVRSTLSQVKTIVVKFCRRLPLATGQMNLPLDSRTIWYFSLDQDGDLVYNANQFPLYTFTSVAHALFTCSAPYLRRLPDPPSDVCRSAFAPETEAHDETLEGTEAENNEPLTVTNEAKSTVDTNASEVGGTTAPSDITSDSFWTLDSPGDELSRFTPYPMKKRDPTPQTPRSKAPVVQLVKVQDDSGVVLDISWDSFAFLPEVKNLLHFIRTSVVRELERVVESCLAAQPVDLSVATVAVRTVFGQDGAGLSLTDNTLTINLHCYSKLDGTWDVGIIDSDSFFFEKKIHHLCSRWRTGSMNLTASFDRTTQHLTHALGFPVSIPAAGQTTLELLCRVEGKQMTHPYQLLKIFVKALSQHVSDGYVQAVVTALSFSGHCWRVGQADVPSSLWCWTRLSAIAQRKPGERYLVLSRSKHGRTLFHTMRGSDVLQAAPETVAGVWHRRDQAVVGSTGLILQDVLTDRVQLVTVNGHVFMTTQSRATAKFMSSLPLSVEIGMGSETAVTKTLYFDDIFLRPLELGSRTEWLSSTSPYASTLMECWQLASSLGFHLVFDLQDIAAEDAQLKDRKYLMSSRLTLETLRDVTDAGLYGENVVQIVKKLLNALGTVIVSHKIIDQDATIIRGSEHNEEVNIYLLTERDLNLTPLPSVWNRPEGRAWPNRFTETLHCTLCTTFSLQTRSQLSSLFDKKLSRNIPMDSIAFIEFTERTDKLKTLAMSYEAVTGFLAALTHFVERYLSGMRKLKADLTSVLFIEEVPAGPVVSLHAGVLQVGLFKGGQAVERKMFVRDLLVAVAVDEDIDDEDLAPCEKESPRVPLLLHPRSDNACLGLSVASSARRRVPKVHRIVKVPSDNKYILERAIQRLLVGAESGKTGDIIDSLDIGANVNSLNQNDETPLLLAAKGRNYVIQELLLNRGADVNLADQGGMTALHYESGHGDSEAVKLLLAHGADPNMMDVTGRTPLHFSVMNCHADTTDALVFCGADASIANKEGRTPRSLCQGRPQKLMMRRSEVTIRGLATGHVFVEHLVLEADTTYTPEGIGISLRTPQTMGQVQTRLMLRRVTPEYSTCGLLPAAKEQLLSDIYEFRMSGARVEGAMILRIPVHGRPGVFDDVFVKTDKGAYSAALRAVRQENDQGWVCHVRINLNDVNAIILVARPRIERFTVTSSGGDYTSSLDSRLRVHVLQNSFKNKEELALEVLTSPTFDEEEFDHVLSLSHFYSLTPVSDNHQRPLNDLIVSIPLPDNFLGQGDLFVLLRRTGKAAGQMPQLEQWDVISKNPDVLEGMVKFRTPDLGLLCLLEKGRPSPHSNMASADSSAVRYVTRLHRKAEEGEHDVIVFALARHRLGSGGLPKDVADAVVEITLSRKLHSRLEHWKSLGYVDLKPCFSNTFIAQPAQEFIVQVGGCCQDADRHLSTLMFHPMRENALCFSVAQRHLPGTGDSWVDVFASQHNQRAPSQMTNFSATTSTSKVDSVLESTRPRSTNHVAKLMLKLPWPRTQEQQEEERMIKFATLSPFTEDQNTGILESVSWGLGSDWVKASILLGVSPATITMLKDTHPLNDGQRALRMLQQWRHSRAPRQDRGVSELLVTLQKAGREDLVKVALNRLRHWLAVHGVSSGPMADLLQEKTLSSGRNETLIDVEKDTPEPMSGMFLRYLSRELGPRFDLAADLGVSKPEVDTIMADPLLVTDEDKMFKLLLLSRDKREKMEEGLRMLLDITRDKKMTSAHSWIVHNARRWVVLQGTTDDRFAHAVGELLCNVAGVPDSSVI